MALYAATVRLYESGLQLWEAVKNPVDDACYVFADDVSADKWAAELSPRDLLQPVKSSPAYRAARSFARSHTK